MTELHDARYEMELGGGGDIWRLTGNVVNHPNFPDGHQVYVSTPVSFDETDDTMVTGSGRQYRIVSYYNREKTVEQIKKDIANRGYEIH